MNDSPREEPWLQIAVLMGAVGILLLALLSGRGVRLTQTYTYASPDGRLEFNYPIGWSVEEGARTTFLINDPQLMQPPDVPFRLSSGQAAIGFVPPPFEGGALDNLNDDTHPIDTLDAYLSQLPGRLTPFGESVAIEIGGQDAALVSGAMADEVGSEIDTAIVILDTGERGDGNFILMILLAAKGELQRFQPILLTAASSLTYTP